MNHHLICRENKRPATQNAETGFTLLEMLVVIAIVGILAALLIPAFDTRERGTMRTRCLSHIKSINLGVYTYASENRDRLPTMQEGNWVWDMPVAVADAFLTNGITTNTFYDPGFRDMYTAWNDGSNATPPYRSIGYALTFPGTASLIPSNGNHTIIPMPISAPPPGLPAPDLSKRVLIAGATISASGEKNLTNRSANHYTGIQGRSTLKLRAAHLDSAGRLPTGDNVAMLDGSARWQKFTNMIPRTVGNSPVFWW